MRFAQSVRLGALALGGTDEAAANARVNLVDVATASGLNLTLFTLFATAGFFLVVGGGPESRWATRWAWVWLSLTPVMVFVVSLYVLVGARPDPSRARRLTGGWAFLITLFVFSGS